MEREYEVTSINYKRGMTSINYYRVTVDRKTSYYTKYEELDNGYAKVMKNGKWAILTPCGKMLGKKEYAKIYEFYEDMIRVKKNSKYGYINRNSERIIDCIYEKAGDFKNGVAEVLYKGNKYKINKLGRLLDTNLI